MSLLLPFEMFICMLMVDLYVLLLASAKLWQRADVTILLFAVCRVVAAL